MKTVTNPAALRSLLRVLAPCLLLLPLLRAAAPQEPEPAGAGGLPRAVFLVRHAEKEAEPREDPGLTAEGAARAEELARVLGKAGVTHLFSSDFRRTRLTLAPLAERTGLEVVTRSARDVEGLVQVLRELPDGAVAVVAGHSNTVPAVAAGLGAELADLHEYPYGLALEESDYDRLPLVLLPPRGAQGAARALELRYGAPDGD